MSHASIWHAIDDSLIRFKRVVHITMGKPLTTWMTRAPIQAVDGRLTVLIVRSGHVNYTLPGIVLSSCRIERGRT